jgi:plastocyanin
LPVALLAVALAGSGCAVGPAPTSSGAAAAGGPVTEVVIGTDDGAALRFVPSTVHAPSGRAVRVTFQNRSAVSHNLIFMPPFEGGTRTIVEAGGTDVVGFGPLQAGAMRFGCTIHQGMEGVLIVD